MDWRQIFLLCFIGTVYTEGMQLRPSSAQTEPVTKSQNESYVVTCMTNSTAKGEWIGPSGKLPVGTGRVHVEDRGPYGVTLVFDRIEISDKGVYTCKANNEQVNFTLLVHKVPRLKNTPLEQHVREFDTRVIRCEVEAEPKPMISWLKNGVKIEEITNRNYTSDKGGLKVINASRADAGVFTCRAMQISSGEIYTWDIRLKVQHKPEWKEPGEEVKALGYLTGETNLTCDAVAEPEANYTWSRVNHSHKHLPLNSTEIREPGRSVLKLYVHNDTYGSYKCEAFNHLGRISRVYSLSPGKKPSPPTGFRAVESDTTVHTATIKIASDTPDDDLVGFRIRFVISRPGVEVSWDKPDFQDVAKNDKGHYVIVDLLEDTSYAVQVATRSVAGLSDFTDNYITLRTLKNGQSNHSWRIVGHPLLLLLSIIVCKTVH